MTRQTAVFYIEDNLVKVKEGHQYIVLGGEEYINIKHIKSIVEQSKAMEKEQRIKDYNVGYTDAQCNHISDAENYINEQEYLNSK